MKGLQNKNQMSLDLTLYHKPTCPKCGHEFEHDSISYEFNITHNLARMANAAGIGMLWDDEWTESNKASELAKHLTNGIAEMEANPMKYRALSSPNGWGTYDHFLPWLKELLDRCNEYPQARISISR